MTRNRKVIWNGIEYPKLKLAAEARGVTTVTMWRWLRRGWTHDADIDVPVPQIGNMRAKPVMWNGVEYDTVTAAAHANDKYQPQMSNWVNRGYMSDEDVRAGRKRGGRPKKRGS